jgi:hypothetical protein
MKKTIHYYNKANLLIRLLFVLMASGIAGNVGAQTTVTIGSTTTTTSTYMLPINNLYGYTYSQQVLLASEIGIPGRISKIRFRYNTGSLALNDDWTVYLGYKTAGTFASTTDWVPLTSLIQVYSGTVTAANNWIEITLATPFIYSPGNGNLVIAVDENSPSYTYTSTMFPTNAGNNRSIYYRSDGTNPSPASPPTGTLYSFFNTIQLDLLGLAPCAGTPSGGTTLASPSTVCLGNSSSLGISGGTTDTGTVFQWQDSVVGGTWQNIAGATGFLYTTAPMTANRYFRRRITCLSSNGVAYSSPVLVRIQSNTLPYLETFDSIAVANDLPSCMTATNMSTQSLTYVANQTTYNRINHTPLPGGNKFFSFRYATGTDVLATPGFTLQAGSTYLFTFWYITDGLTGWTNLSAYWGSAPTVAGLTNLIGSAPSPQTNTTYQQFTGTFTPTATGVYYLGIVCTRTSAPWYLSIDDIGLSELVPCSGTPLAGVIDSVRPCPNQPFTLTTTGGSSPTSFGGLTFEWQDSTVNGWVSSAGVNTNPTYTTSVSVPTRYRRVITCANGSQTAITPTYLVVPAPFINCYCVPTYATGATSSIITNVKLNGLNNTSTGASPWYTDYSRQQPSPIMIPTITMGVTDSVIVTQGTNTTNYSGVWIDFNQSGHFEPSEYFTLGTNAGANGVARIPVNTPLTARPGLTRMRIRAGDRSPVTAVMPCNATASVYGEAEDYLVNIQYPVCSGPTNAGRAEATDTVICIGYTINVYDTTHEYRRSRITWSWENSTDGGFSWNPVAGSQNKDTLLNILVTRAVQYRLKMVCDETGDSTYSTVANIRINAPYACYCISQSNGGAADVSDIGAVVIGEMVNSTGGPHLMNPTAVRRRTDYTDIRNIVLSANGRYHLSVFHTQRNDAHADALVTVFVDYNNDLRYDATATPNSERVFQGISTAPDYYIDTAFRIPNAVIPNVPTGLRVILNNDLNPNSPANQGCGTYTSGETEDYVVMFTRSPQHVSGLVNLEHVTLYPNPTTGRFMLSVGAQQTIGKLDVVVTTLTGSKVLHQEYQRVGTKFGQELDLGNVARGVYFVAVTTEGGEKMVQKLIVK